MQTAVILAAGRGSKMWPYGETQPKACLPVVGAPLIGHTVQHLINLGVQNIIVVVGHLAAQVRHAVGRHSQVAFHEQSSPGGTAEALSQVHAVHGLADCLVIYGDVLVSQEDLARLIETHNRNKALATTLVAPTDGEPAGGLITAEIEGNKLRRIVGHPRGASRYRWTGIFTLRREAWKWITNNPGLVTSVQVGQMPPLEAEAAQSLQDMVSAGESVEAVVTEGYFVDLDKPWHILEANQVFLAQASKNLRDSIIPASARISPEADIRGRLVLGENVVIGPRVVVKGDLWVADNTIIDNGAIIGESCYIGSNCRIRDYCLIESHSSIGDSCVVAHCAEFGGVLMERVYLYHYMEIYGVVGRCTDIGAATVCGTLRFDDGARVQNIKGYKEIPHVGANAAYIGDFCRTGVNAMLMPGTKIGSYSVVGPGVLVSEDVPSRTMVLLQQQTVTRSWGPERYGW
ncbi:MAG: NTP transferase domain-containing protein [Firmicutes bacterium]|jgi:bifunctional UDP-N-acetylglucosamine pyrophosphorylase/glucosamine-1-phosphate N-acetyltransferase|nr:NTP transferase domain-containing protein [Bacillota bacterium]